MVRTGAPESIPCKQKIASMSLQARLYWPLPNDTWENSVQGMTEKHTDGDREVYIMGHGTWNSYDANATRAWITEFEDHYREPVPWFRTSPRLFLTPSAIGEAKPARFLERGNNIVLQQFIHEIEPFIEERGFEHLSFFNMSLQADSPDGTVSSWQYCSVKGFKDNFLTFNP